MSNLWIAFSLFVTALVWVFLGACVGIASIFLSGSIAAVLLGIILGGTGAVVHVAYQLVPQRLQKQRWWVMPSIIALASTIVTLLVVAQFREFVIVAILLCYYLVFGTILYFLIEKTIARP